MNGGCVKHDLGGGVWRRRETEMVSRGGGEREVEEGGEGGRDGDLERVRRRET